MGTPKQAKLKTFSGVKAGEVATSSVPKKILLHFADFIIAAGSATGGAGTGGGRTLAETVDSIEFRLNSVAQQTWTGAQIEALNKRNGSPFDISTVGTGATFATYLRAFFNEQFRRDPYLARAFGWNLNDNPGAPGSGDMEIAIKFNAACTAPSVTGVYWFDDSVKPIGEIVKVKQTSKEAIGAALDLTSVLNLGPADKARRLFSMHIWPTVGGTVRYANEITLDYGGQTYRKELGYLLNRFALQKAEMSPDTGATPRFDVEFDMLDPIQEALPLVPGANHNLNIKFDGAANGNLPLTFIYQGQPD